MYLSDYVVTVIASSILVGINVSCGSRSYLTALFTVRYLPVIGAICSPILNVRMLCANYEFAHVTFAVFIYVYVIKLLLSYVIAVAGRAVPMVLRIVFPAFTKGMHVLYLFLSASDKNKDAKEKAKHKS